MIYICFVTCLVIKKICLHTFILSGTKIPEKGDYDSFCKFSLQNEKYSKLKFTNFNPKVHEIIKSTVNVSIMQTQVLNDNIGEEGRCSGRVTNRKECIIEHTRCLG